MTGRLLGCLQTIKLSVKISTDTTKPELDASHIWNKGVRKMLGKILFVIGTIMAFGGMVVDSFVQTNRNSDEKRVQRIRLILKIVILIGIAIMIIYILIK